MSSNAGTAVREGWKSRVKRNSNFKKPTNRYHLCLFALSNNVDLKNNNRNYRKHSEFTVWANNCTKLFKFDLDKPRSYL